MILEETTNKSTIHHIFPELQINPCNQYIIIKQYDDILGLFELQLITKITAIVHMHIIEKFQNMGFGPTAFKTLVTNLKTSSIQNLLATIPAKNNHILSIVNKTKAKCCGLIKDGIIFNNELQDILIFELRV